ncbi:MAG TPA: peptidoglycan DD-metalloendopeptidase family protein [Wenzhouxiangella sp.]
MVVALLWLTGCASTTPAPVVHRSGLGTATAIAPATYTVRSGDSLYSIAFRYGLDWQDVAAWNGIQSPYVIRLGDQLRLRAPVGRRVAVTRDSRSNPSPRINETRPLSQVPPSQARPTQAPVRDEPKSVTVVTAPAEQVSRATRRVDGLDWQWPLEGTLARTFDPSATRRGLGINGASGDVVVAAADGEVVYSGTALIGYGELVIIKHSPTLLSAYGYNRRRLVDEGMRVEAGAPIAELGQNTDGQWQLHFEIRRNGDAVDPRAFLPTSNQ